MAACSAAAATCLSAPGSAPAATFPCPFDGTRYRRGPPKVPNMRAVLKKASSGTRRVFRSIRCKKQASTVRKRYSVPKTASSGTRRTFKGALNGILSHRTHLQRPAEQPTPQTVDSLLPHWTHFRGGRAKSSTCPPDASLEARRAKSSLLPHRTHLQCAKRPPLSLFAPAPSTIFFVPLTRNLSPAAPSLAPSTALGTRNGPRSKTRRTASARR